MDSKKSNLLIEKYIKGTTSTNEEKYLIENAEESTSVFKPWLKFIKQNKIEAPSNIKESIWGSIQAKKTEKQRRLNIVAFSVAASILLLFSLLTFYMEQKKQNYKRKEALLTEVKKMFDTEQNTTNKVQPKIIYEDNMIIIYTTLE